MLEKKPKFNELFFFLTNFLDITFFFKERNLVHINYYANGLVKKCQKWNQSVKFNVFLEKKHEKILTIL